MTLTKIVRIIGCSKEWGPWTSVDLDEPGTIGQNPNYPGQYCDENPLKESVTLEVIPTGKVINDEGKSPKHAEVLIYCRATGCPLHK